MVIWEQWGKVWVGSEGDYWAYKIVQVLLWVVVLSAVTGAWMLCFLAASSIRLASGNRASKEALLAGTLLIFAVVGLVVGNNWAAGAKTAESAQGSIGLGLFLGLVAWVASIWLGAVNYVMKGGPTLSHQGTTKPTALERPESTVHQVVDGRTRLVVSSPDACHHCGNTRSRDIRPCIKCGK
jgi:hypothetical protein